MKKKYLFLLLVSFLSIFFYFSTKDVKLKNSIDRENIRRIDTIYQIVKIDSVDNIFLIYAERNDSIFKILSTIIFVYYL